MLHYVYAAFLTDLQQHMDHKDYVYIGRTQCVNECVFIIITFGFGRTFICLSMEGNWSQSLADCGG